MKGIVLLLHTHSLSTRVLGGTGVGGTPSGAGSWGFGLFEVGGVGMGELDLVAILSTFTGSESPTFNMLLFCAELMAFPSLIASISAFTFKLSFLVCAVADTAVITNGIVNVKINFFIVISFFIQPRIRDGVLSMLVTLLYSIVRL